MMGYISRTPEPEDMSHSFTTYLAYAIAAQLALKNIQQKNVFENLRLQSVINKHAARKFSLDNSSYFEYSMASLATAPLTTNRLGQTLETTSPKLYKYIRGN